MGAYLIKEDLDVLRGAFFEVWLSPPTNASVEEGRILCSLIISAGIKVVRVEFDWDQAQIGDAWTKVENKMSCVQKINKKALPGVSSAHQTLNR